MILCFDGVYRAALFGNENLIATCPEPELQLLFSVENSAWVRALDSIDPLDLYEEQGGI